MMRVAGPPAHFESIQAVLKDIQRIRPDVRAERRPRDGVVVCDISADPSWKGHQRAIVQFVTDCSEPIRRVANCGGNVSVDVAIDPDDMAPNPYFCIHADVDFLKILVEYRIELEFTVYGCNGIPQPPESRPVL
ncbi:hypothetical protein [Polyangium spumosum]|uniref:hypothetical protein n=1 Tax=Polyangium spumosum TaxID=889282 RepID=UPI00129B7211|nr:hypothetical protein [Polyangium spumosum]